MAAKKKLHCERRKLTELSKSKDLFFVKTQRTFNFEMKELEIKGQTQIDDSNRKLNLLKS